MLFRRSFPVITNFVASHQPNYYQRSSWNLYSTSPEKNQMVCQTLWIDTDCGYDDLCAISMLQDYSMSPFSDMKIEFISTVNGMTNPLIGAKIIKNFLEVNNFSASVACGFESSSSQPHSITDAGWGIEYRRSFLSFMADQHLIQNDETGLSADLSMIGEGDTIDCMVKRIIEQKSDIKITLLCLGPLTNIAYIMRKYPSFFGECVQRLVLMGGAVFVNGNAPGGAEYNFYLDVESASFVFRNSVVPIEMFGLDVANDEALTPDQYKQIMKPSVAEENASTSQPRKIRKFIRSLIEKNKDAISYDSIASYYLICPDAFTLQPLDIEVDTITGQTVSVSKEDMDKKLVISTSVSVATSVCKSSYFNYLLNTLSE